MSELGGGGAGRDIGLRERTDKFQLPADCHST